MTRRDWLDLSPSLVLGAGIIVSTLVAVLAGSGWWVMAGPLLLALTVVGVDVLGSRLRGVAAGPSPAALLLGGAFLLASLIVALSDPSYVKTFLPILGAASGVSLRPRSEDRRGTCRYL